ncbi:MAG TPA: glycoside hydrolase family 43 protein [Polyangiaceae bacterium]|nr:glycoside hydrolase family 43 protein [Polyangiaceae bacterium]
MTRSALVLGAVSMLPSRARADNPIIQTNYTADPAPMVHEGRLYLYTSHDEDVTRDNFYTMIDWRLYSTVDMVNWTDHGSPASLDTFSWSTDSAWAPQGIVRNGEYYLYVPINNNTGARIGVGVSDNVAGPFMDPLGRELAASGSGNIDPTVFIDDDDQAYMYWGNGTLRYVRLNQDMISISGTPTNVDLPGFTEGPWFYKRESLYYLVYAATSGTEKISYATSDSPTGPWTVRGDIMGPGVTFTNHAGVIDYEGHSYFFYHNSALPGGGDFKRSVCVEEFTYGDDGSIPPLTMSDEGPAAIASLDPFSQVEAETIAFSSGLKTEECDDTGAGMNVTSISDGDYIKVKDVEFLDGVTSFEARVSSASAGATIELHLDSQTGTLLGTCDVSSASSWTTVTCPVSGGSGKHDLFLTFTGGGDNLFKFNWWKFTGPTQPTGAGGAGGTGGAGGMGGATGTGTDVGGAGGGTSTTGSSDGTVGSATSTTGSTAGPVGGTSTTGSSVGPVGGTSTTGGSVGTSGATAGNSTTTGSTATSTNGAPAGGSGDDEDGGCSCRFTRTSSPPGPSMLALAIAALGAAAGRRRRTRRA